MDGNLTVCILGMGYIGTTTAAALAELGHQIIGVEKDLEKVATFQSGSVPFDEPGLDDLFAAGMREDRIRVVTPDPSVVASSHVAMICVGTPSTQSGEVDLSSVLGLIEDLATAIDSDGNRLGVVALRSTSPPGTVARVEHQLNARLSGSTNRIPVVSNPEFLREGTALDDFFDPPFTVIGSNDPGAIDLMKHLYRDVDRPVCVTEPESAELLKYVCNGFHALKVAFANEIGSLAAALGVDSHRLMQVFTQDDKLNVSKRYLSPGFAFGGSCLPKDVRALSGLLRREGVSAPLIQSILPSNDAHLGRASEHAMRQIPEGTIGVAGLAFKEGTNDFRESPYVHLVRDLMADGRKVRVYDPTLTHHELMGANAEFMQRVLPQYRTLQVPTSHDLVNSSDGIVVTRRSLLSEFSESSVPVLKFFGVGSFHDSRS